MGGWRGNVGIESLRGRGEFCKVYRAIVIDTGVCEWNVSQPLSKEN